MNGYIIDLIAEIMNTENERSMSRKTGLSREKIRRITHCMPFIFDWKVVSALSTLGYKIKIEKVE